MHRLAQFFRNPINLFSPVLLVLFLLVLIWLGKSRHEQFATQHELIAGDATRVATNEIESQVASLRNLLEIFVEDNYRDISALAEDPDNEKFREKIDAKLKRYFPDYFSFSIANNTGAPLFEDFNGYVGDLCVADMKQSAATQKPLLRVHPNPYVYHVDIMVNFSVHKENMIMLVSFELGKFAQLLKLSSPESHNLVLVQPDNDFLIEITENGGRDKLLERDSLRLSSNEISRVLSSTRVSGTLWELFDIRRAGLFEQYRASLLKEGAVIYSTFMLIVVMMWVLLLRYDNKRKGYERQILVKSEEIGRLNEDLQILSVTDEQTGLKNRRYFNTRLIEEWKRAVRAKSALGLALIDIDYFKQYNDTYGHQAGDECLEKIAMVMSSRFKRVSEFVARYGGEEFSIVLSEGSQEETRRDFENLCESIKNENIEHKTSPICDSVTISVGVVFGYPGTKSDMDDFVKVADEALYEAKRAGRNRVVFRNYN